MEKLNPHTDGITTDIVTENIEKLREILPDAFTEGSAKEGPRWKVDIEALREILGEYVEDQPERYSFNWNGKSRARLIAQTPSAGTLRPCSEESVHWDTTQNLFIEGDNLEVLKLLQKSYHKKVKMIYIDPPYNTGKDFIYPDNFRENISNYLKLTGQLTEEGMKISANTETSGRYHTDWLNMMYPRLKLARNLLCEDGVIFISIGSVELSSLIKLMDEIFGEENRVTVASREMKKGANRGTHFAPAIDFIVAYARNILELGKFFDLVTQEYIDSFIRDDQDGRGKYKTTNLYEPTLDYYQNCRYPINCPDGTVVITPERKSCSHNKESFNELLEDNRIIFHEGKSSLLQQIDGSPTKWTIKRKLYLNEMLEKGRRPSDLILDLINANGTKEIKALGLEFSFSKPSDLMKYLIQIINDKESIILDFFSGSCATAHAVLKLNIEEKGNHRFIMVQLPEPCNEKSKEYKAGFKTISEIGKERIHRVIKKIECEHEEKARKNMKQLPSMEECMPKLDLGFKVFKLDASNIKPWDADFDNLEDALFDSVDNIKPDRSEADVLYELLLKYGLDLAVPIEERQIDGKTVYIIGAGALVVCLADKISLQVVEGIAALKGELKPEIMRVVFKDAGFADDVVKTNAVQILRQAEIEDVKSL